MIPILQIKYGRERYKRVSQFKGGWNVSSIREDSLSRPLLHPQFWDSIRLPGSKPPKCPYEEAELEIHVLVLAAWSCCFSLVPRDSQLFLCFAFPAPSLGEALPPPYPHSRWLCRAPSFCEAVRAVNWVLECAVGKAFVHPGNIHSHTEIWLISKVRWEQLPLCVHRPGTQQRLTKYYAIVGVKQKS